MCAHVCVREGGEEGGGGIGVGGEGGEGFSFAALTLLEKDSFAFAFRNSFDGFDMLTTLPEDPNSVLSPSGCHRFHMHVTFTQRDADT